MKNILNTLFALTLSFIMGCNNYNTKDSVESKKEKLDSVVSLDVSNDSIASKEDKYDSIPLISGSCENGREIGDFAQYWIKMKIGTSPTDSISTRSDASCFEIKSCDHNVLGKIKSGTIIYAQGPLKNNDFSAGIAYAFPVKDKNGNVCRAYLSYLNVEKIKTTHIKK